jgi:hypothetical protein
VILLTIAYLPIRSRRDRITLDKVARAKPDFRDRGSPVWFTGDRHQLLWVFPGPQASRPRIPPATSNPKDKSTERIDGIVATIMAIGRALVAQEEPQPEYSLHFV